MRTIFKPVLQHSDMPACLPALKVLTLDSGVRVPGLSVPSDYYRGGVSNKAGVDTEAIKERGRYTTTLTAQGCT